MIILGAFLLAVIGEQLGGWFILGCVASIILGVVLTVVLPGKEEDYPSNNKST
jgi:hypothetical protein